MKCGWLLGAAMLFAGTLVAENLLQDSGFEKPLRSKGALWKSYGGGKTNRIEFLPDGTGNVLKLTDTMPEKSIGVRQKISLAPGRNYRAAVEVKALPGQEGKSLFMQVRLLPQKIIHQVEVKAVSAGRFQTVEMIFPVPQDVTAAEFYLYTHARATLTLLLRHPRVELYNGEFRVTPEKMSPGEKKAAAIPFPADCTVARLNRTPRPVVFLDAETNLRARKNLQKTRHLQQYLARQTALVRELVRLSDGELRALFPAPGSDILYGLGLNVCPEGTRLRWAGLRNPFQVIGKDNKLYPNDASGPKEKTDYTNRAHGFIFGTMEQVLLPALADCYLLTGEKKYAHCAAVLLDRVAVNYRANKRGPLDYPTSPGDFLRGGRLQRPYYATARGLMNYVHTFDAILPSGELEAPSVVPGRTMGENIIRDLLWNGAIYCLGFAYDGARMHNGHVDYVRGAAAVGLLLNVPELAAPLFSEDLGFPAVMNTAINRNGLYTESSFMYSQHSIALYRDLAVFYDSAVRQKWPGIRPVYDDPVFCYLLDRYAEKLEVGGKIPMTGDDGPQLYVAPPNARARGKKKWNVDRGFARQLPGVWTLYANGSPEQRAAAAQFLRDFHQEEPVNVPDERLMLWKITEQDLQEIGKLTPRTDFLNKPSHIFGSKGLALIRGGRGEDRHGFQMLFGPQLNHGQAEALSWTFFYQGAEWSYDPGYLNTHYRMGWTSTSVAHQQMVVDGERAALLHGGGELLAFRGSNPSGLQYVMAKQDHAFAKAKRFERLLGQADHPESGKLEYWLDLGIVAGGTFRDDSFHTAMCKAEYNRPFTSTGEHSLFGDLTKGMTILPNYRLSGYPDKDFYWRLPGNGYGMLIQPALWRSGESLQAVYTVPGLHLQPGQKLDAMVANFPGEPGREYYAVKNMHFPRHKPVPYLIRRDRGSKTSFFAKVLHFRDEAGREAVQAVSSVPVDGENDARAYLITLKDGRKDLWIIGSGNTLKKVNVPGLPEVTVQGRIAAVRFGADGKAAFVHASDAVRATAGSVQLSGMDRYRGTIRKLEDARPGNIAFEVDWELGPETVLQDTMAVLTRAPNALPGNWTAYRAEGDRLLLTDLRTMFSRVRLEAVPGKKGSYRTRPELVQLYTPLGGGASRDIARGKFVCIGKTVLGTVQDLDIVKSDCALLQIRDRQGNRLDGLDGKTVDLMEAVAGTRVELLHNLFYQAPRR